jgi:hypothetical protein
MRNFEKSRGDDESSSHNLHLSCLFFLGKSNACLDPVLNAEIKNLPEPALAN